MGFGMDEQSLWELMGRVGALEAALNSLLTSVHTNRAVRDDVLASLERMADVLEVAQDPAAKAFASGWRLAMQSLLANSTQSG